MIQENCDVQPFFGGLEVHVYRLPNGLDLRVVPDRAAPVVAIQTWYRVGSSQESSGKTGLAHLFEHLMFKGTLDYPDGAFQSRLDAVGATGLNAWTWLDQTVYTEAVPVGALRTALELEASRMHRLSLTDEVFQAERQVVMNERRMAVDDDPGGKLSELLFADAFRDHPYGWPTIGWMKDIEGLTLEDVRAFYARWYAPDNATLFLVGDVDPAEVAALVQEVYGHIPPAHPVRAPLPVEPPQGELRRLEHPLQLSGDRLVIGFKVPAYTHPDTAALLVLDVILGTGRTGRLARALVDRGLATDVGSGVLPLREPSLMEVDVRARPGVSAEALEAVVWEELERLGAEGPSQGELAKGISLWQKSAWMALENAKGKAEFLGWSTTHTGDHRDGMDRLAAIQAVSLEDLRRVAATYLRKQGATVMIGRATPAEPALEVGPHQAPATLPLISVAARPAGAPPQAVAGAVEVRPFHGATLISLYDPTLPITRFRLVFPAGSGTDPAGQEGRAFLAGMMLVRGTQRRPREDFEAALEQLGASISVSVDADDTQLSGSSLSAHWPALLALLAEALLEPAFAEEELAQLVEESVAEISAAREDDAWLASRQLAHVLYGPAHPYGRLARGSAESLRALTPAQLRDFHRDHLRGEGAFVAVGGAWDQGTEADLRSLLEGLSGAPAALPPFAAGHEVERRLWIVDKPERTQAQLRAMVPSLHASDPAYPAFVLANDIFGVGFTGRMMREVREARGWSYVAWSAPVSMRAEGHWTLGLAPSVEQLPDALALVRRMVAEAASDGFTEAELEQARAARLAGRPFLVDTWRKRLDSELRRLVTGYDHLAAIDQMEHLSLEAVSAAFQRAVDPDRLVWSMTATASAVREGIEGRFGPAEVVPYQAV
ncbi:MAG: insulinase family protein [Deltaproteobacteria bacterium]|nr:insulinase family protein [Deltaproteobacteria bacterium]